MKLFFRTILELFNNDIRAHGSVYPSVRLTNKIMNVIEVILEFIFTPSLVKLGIAIGVIIAACAWYLLPEHIDRAAFGAWSIALGFIGGWIFSYQSKNEK